jgi:hypothetical protein
MQRDIYRYIYKYLYLYLCIYISIYLYMYVGAAIFQLLQSTANVKAPGAGGGPVEAEP